MPGPRPPRGTRDWSSRDRKAEGLVKECEEQSREKLPGLRMHSSAVWAEAIGAKVLRAAWACSEVCPGLWPQEEVKRRGRQVQVLVLGQLKYHVCMTLVEGAAGPGEEWPTFSKEHYNRVERTRADPKVSFLPFFATLPGLMPHFWWSEILLLKTLDSSVCFPSDTPNSLKY